MGLLLEVSQCLVALQLPKFLWGRLASKTTQHLYYQFRNTANKKQVLHNKVSTWGHKAERVMIQYIETHCIINRLRVGWDKLVPMVSIQLHWRLTRENKGWKSVMIRKMSMIAFLFSAPLNSPVRQAAIIVSVHICGSTARLWGLDCSYWVSS